jgi:Amt family ammonium transporter
MAVPFTNSETSFLTQFVGVAATGVFVMIASSLVWLVIKYTIGIRCSEEDEYRGLDLAEIGMEAYPDFQTIHIGGGSSLPAHVAAQAVAAATAPVKQS